MRYLVPTIRPILEDLAGTLAFYLLYLATGSARWAAGVALMLGVGQAAAHVIRRRPIPALLIMGVGLTAVLGVATTVTHDARFILFKPAIIYIAIGSTMLPRGWLVRYVPPIVVELLPRSTFDRLGWAWAVLIGGTGLMNVALLLSQPPKRAATIFAVWAILSKLVLFLVQYVTVRGRAHGVYRTRAAAMLADRGEDIGT